MRIKVFAVVLATISIFIGCREKKTAPAASGKTAVLRYTAIPDQNSTELETKFRPLSDYLSKTLGVPVEYVPVRDYQAAVESFKNGDVLLAWYGGLTAPPARKAV